MVKELPDKIKLPLRFNTLYKENQTDWLNAAESAHDYAEIDANRQLHPFIDRIKELEAIVVGSYDLLEIVSRNALTKEEAGYINRYVRNEYGGAGGSWAKLSPILSKLSAQAKLKAISGSHGEDK